MLRTTTLLSSAALITMAAPVFANQSPTINTETARPIFVYNNFQTNSNKPIWVVVEGKNTYDGSKHYRSASTELMPGQSHEFDVPADGWNSGRVYIYDQTPPPGNVSDAGSYQLLEYTFIPQGGVSYDYSAVDSLHNKLPVVIEAKGIPTPQTTIGYKGTVFDPQLDSDPKATQALQDDTENFVTKFGWPYFKESSNPSQHKYKIPGGRLFLINANNNTLGFNPVGTQAFTADKLVAKWTWWLNPNACNNVPAKDQTDGRNMAFCKAFQQNLISVYNGFHDNIKNATGKEPTALTIVSNIIGFAPMGDGATAAALFKKYTDPSRAIESGTPYWPNGTPAEYKNLPLPNYDSVYNVNPYVKFIHDKNGANLNIYAYSFDDAAGLVNAPNNALTIAVGGLKGVDNKKPLTPNAPPAPSSEYHLNMGPGWSSASVCGSATQLNSKVGTSTPISFAGKSSCTVNLNNSRVTLTIGLDGNKNLVKSSCTGDQGICGAIQMQGKVAAVPAV